MKRNSFVFYKEWMDAIRDLPDDVRLDIYESVIMYATTGGVRGLKSMANIAFNFIRTTIDRDIAKYVSVVERNQTNGSRGGRPRKAENQNNPLGYSETTENPKKPKKPDNDNEYDNVNDKEEKHSNECKKNAHPFVPPSLGQVKEYFREKGYTEDAAAKAYNYYSAGDWKDINGKAVKNWKQKCIAVWFKPENAANTHTKTVF